MKNYNRKKRTAEEVQKLIDRYERGETLREIGQSEELSRERIRQLFEQVGYARRRNTISERLIESYSKRKKHLPRAELERLYVDEKKTAREIGEILGCNAVLVYINLRRYDIPVRNYTKGNRLYRRKYPELTEENLCRWRIEEKKRVRQIAEAIGCRVDTVYKSLRGFKIQKPPTIPKPRKSRAKKFLTSSD